MPASSLARTRPEPKPESTLELTPGLATHGVPDLHELRRLVLEDALTRSFDARGRLRTPDRDTRPVFGSVLRPEVDFAAIAAHEFVDPDGPFAGDERLRAMSVGALDNVSAAFRPDGRVGLEGDGAYTGYFALVPATDALLTLGGEVDAATRDRVVERCVRLHDATVAHLDLAQHALNPRGLEAVGSYGLYRLTGEQRFLDRTLECLDYLLARQYHCGAQPYHTAGATNGKHSPAPAQQYQYLTGILMLHLGLQLGREDVVAYVRRLAGYALLSTSGRGAPFTTTAIGLNKGAGAGGPGRTWVMLTALADHLDGSRDLDGGEDAGGARYRPLAAAAYAEWVHEHALDFGRTYDRKTDLDVPSANYVGALHHAHLLGIRAVPPAAQFAPPPGLHALPDISTVFIHEPRRHQSDDEVRSAGSNGRDSAHHGFGVDGALSLLTHKSSFAQVECGDVRLHAVLPELTDTPTFLHAGTDSRRADWRVPSEQLECIERDGTAVLRGRVWTALESPITDSESDGEGGDAGEGRGMRRHARLLEVRMTYAAGELVLEYETIQNTQPAPVPSRLLFLLIARPAGARPRVRLFGGNGADGAVQEIEAPAADAKETFWLEAGVERAVFSAPDGSSIEIVPEVSTAERLTLERPPARSVAQTATKRLVVKPAPEGSLRLAFEGPNALDRGRYRICFFKESTVHNT